MTDELDIQVEELRAVCHRLLAHLEQVAGGTLTLEKEHFWAISPEQLYDVQQEPVELSIGQLSESWENLQRSTVVDDTVAYELVWLADVLRAVGLQIVR